MCTVPVPPGGYPTAVNKYIISNEYEEYLLRVKTAGAHCEQPYHLHVPIVLKSGNPNLLSRPVQGLLHLHKQVVYREAFCMNLLFVPRDTLPTPFCV